MPDLLGRQLLAFLRHDAIGIGAGDELDRQALGAVARDEWPGPIHRP
jgi:hypothetical protein